MTSEDDLLERVTCVKRYKSHVQTRGGRMTPQRTFVRKSDEKEKLPRAWNRALARIEEIIRASPTLSQLKMMGMALVETSSLLSIKGLDQKPRTVYAVVEVAGSDDMRDLSDAIQRCVESEYPELEAGSL
jgi:hypothetical protein